MNESSERREFTKLYLSGPTDGEPGGDRKTYERIADAIWFKSKGRVGGVTPPLTGNPYIIEEEQWLSMMQHRISKMMEPFDGIAMMDGWEESRAARIEHDLAVALGIPVKPWREYL